MRLQPCPAGQAAGREAARGAVGPGRRRGGVHERAGQGGGNAAARRRDGRAPAAARQPVQQRSCGRHISLTCARRLALTGDAKEHERPAAGLQNGFAQHGAAGAAEDDQEEGSSEKETDYEEEDEEEEEDADGGGPGVVVDAGAQGDAPLELLRGAGVSFGPIQRPITTLLSLSAFRVRLGSPRSASPAAPAQAPPPEDAAAAATGGANAEDGPPGAAAVMGDADSAEAEAITGDLAGMAAGAAAPEHAEAGACAAEDGSLQRLQASQDGRAASAAGSSCAGGEVPQPREEPAEAGSSPQRAQSSDEALCTPAAVCSSSKEEHAVGEGDAGSPAAPCEERCGGGAQGQLLSEAV